MKIKQQYQVRNIAGENVVILQGRYGADLTRIITLNESALLLWNGVVGSDFSIQDLVAILQQNYDVDAATAQRDSELWVEKMKECKLIE
ncbi:MAG: PqqD family protein [Alistipes sp.]|nr:PqqD family protein [Alistipes sp.]